MCIGGSGRSTPAGRSTKPRNSLQWAFLSGGAQKVVSLDLDPTGTSWTIRPPDRRRSTLGVAHGIAVRRSARPALWQYLPSVFAAPVVVGIIEQGRGAGAYQSLWLCRARGWSSQCSCGLCGHIPRCLKPKASSGFWPVGPCSWWCQDEFLARRVPRVMSSWFTP